MSASSNLAEPLVGGVHASDPKKMSLAATFPNLLEMEQEHGSMLKGFLAMRKKVDEMRKKYPQKPGAKPRTFFTSFNTGMQSMTDAMAEAAGSRLDARPVLAVKALIARRRWAGRSRSTMGDPRCRRRDRRDRELGSRAAHA